MKRRQFLKLLGSAGAMAWHDSGMACSREYTIDTVHSFSEHEATIAIRGLKKVTRVLHVADSHISVFDESEAAFHQYAARMDKAYSSVPHYKTGKPTRPADNFLKLMKMGTDKQVQLIALTGDIINNPSPASVRFVAKAVKKTGIPFMYVAGNHDWHYEGLPGTRAQLRQTWIEKSLLPLYGVKNPLYASNVIGGINFVTIDNSTYQVNDEQLKFFRRETARNMPLVLLMHIPLYLPKDAGSNSVSICGDPRWGWDIDKNYKAERRERWSKDGNLPSTNAFVENVKQARNLAAVLVGHTHRSRADTISETAVQYVTALAADGQYRLITFKPLP
ncbi:MAG: metallophosphoesterase [Pirellulales bacterium]|nr:metallophosphoesterase [Pirellulales bacterium]